MARLKILHISNPVNIPTKGYGGTERVVYSLAKTQAENGHDVTIIAGKPSVIPNVKDSSFVEGTYYTERRFIVKRILSMYSIRAFLNSRKDDFDIIHNHVSEEAIPASLLSKSIAVTTLHCPLTLRKFWPFLTTSIASLLPKKTKFVTISKKSFEEFRPFFRNSLITFIRNGIDVTNIPFSQKPSKDHEIQLCFLGKLVYEKQPHLAMKIADILYEWGYDVMLFIMGKLDLPLSRYSKRLIKEAQARKYVTVLPNIETNKLYEILKNCDVFLTTSFEIGLMMSQLEALATGTPIVGFVNSVAEEVVVEGYNGYLGVDSYDVARKCLAALDISRINCRKFVENNFSVHKMYENYMKVYERVIYVS